MYCLWKLHSTASSSGVVLLLLLVFVAAAASFQYYFYCLQILYRRSRTQIQSHNKILFLIPFTLCFGCGSVCVFSIYDGDAVNAVVGFVERWAFVEVTKRHRKLVYSALHGSMFLV